MVLGLFGARSDHRGLATLTHLMWGHLQPAKTVVVDMGRHSPTVFHDGQYGPDATTVTYDDLLAGVFNLDQWLDGLDTVLTFEIPYDVRLYDACRRRGIKTVQLTMPELDANHRDDRLPAPDVFALPTSWMQDRYAGCPVLPVPSAPFKAKRGGLVVHPGSLAMKDRNGTRTVLNASLRTHHPIVVRAQTSPDWSHGRATVEVADLDHSHQLFDNAALVVIPRRYGGLSLVMQEAMAGGLPLLIPESDPYAAAVPREARLRSTRSRDLVAKGGSVPTWDVNPRTLAERIDHVMSDADLRAELATASQTWADSHTWEQVSPAWQAVLGQFVAA